MRSVSASLHRYFNQRIAGCRSRGTGRPKILIRITNIHPEETIAEDHGKLQEKFFDLSINPRSEVVASDNKKEQTKNPVERTITNMADTGGFLDFWEWRNLKTPRYGWILNFTFTGAAVFLNLSLSPPAESREYLKTFLSLVG